MEFREGDEGLGEPEQPEPSGIGLAGEMALTVGIALAITLMLTGLARVVGL